LVTGGAIVTSGTLPNGSYRIIAVPNGAFVPGECYGGPELAAVDVTVTDDTLPATEVWPSATAGRYDVLVLGAVCAEAGPLAAAGAEGGSVIVACDDCSAAAGVEVTPPSQIRRYLRRR
jgi:hypothetical protein